MLHLQGDTFKSYVYGGLKLLKAEFVFSKTKIFKVLYGQELARCGHSQFYQGSNTLKISIKNKDMCFERLDKKGSKLSDKESNVNK